MEEVVKTVTSNVKCERHGRICSSPCLCCHTQKNPMSVTSLVPCKHSALCCIDTALIVILFIVVVVHVFIVCFVWYSIVHKRKGLIASSSPALVLSVWVLRIASVI